MTERNILSLMGHKNYGSWKGIKYCRNSPKEAGCHDSWSETCSHQNKYDRLQYVVEAHWVGKDSAMEDKPEENTTKKQNMTAHFIF